MTSSHNHFADDLIRQLQAQTGIPLRNLPRHLGAALARHIETTGGSPEPPPPKWEAGRPDQPLGYLALYQRILAGTLPEGSKAVERYSEGLRLALSEALHKEIPGLRFRHSEAASQGAVVAAPASTFLADILGARQSEGTLPSKTYTVVLRTLRLAGELPAFGPEVSSNFGQRVESGVLAAFEAEDPAASHLTFARFARLIAAGTLQGMQLRILLDQSLEALRQATRTPVSDLPRLQATASFRVAVLIALKGVSYEDRSLLRLASDPLLDAAAFAHLKAADAQYRADPEGATAELERTDPAALAIARGAIEVRLLADSDCSHAGACRLVNQLPGFRFLVETATSTTVEPSASRAFLWLSLHGDTAKGDPERLLRLDDQTSGALARQLDGMWASAAPAR